MRQLQTHLSALFTFQILERIVHLCFQISLRTQSPIQVQFGFRSQSSTQEALLSVTNTWKTMLFKHKLIAAVFLDVKKAFDSVSHYQLIHSIGIQGSLLNWFGDYLSGRSQCVVLDCEILGKLMSPPEFPRVQSLGYSYSTFL